MPQNYSVPSSPRVGPHDILEMAARAANAGHTAWQSGYDDARAELSRRLRFALAGRLETVEIAQTTMRVVAEFLK